MSARWSEGPGGDRGDRNDAPEAGPERTLSRRTFVTRATGAALALGVSMTARSDAATSAGGEAPAAGRAAGSPRTAGAGDADAMLTRPIPGTGEALPVVGLGTSDTFDVDPAAAPAGAVGEVYDAFVAGGGTVLDTSPMYGKAEAVLGALMKARANRQHMFVATKVWTKGREAGAAQIAESMRLLGTTRLDLLQIHNLVDWREHVPTIRALKDRGAVRYAGITHYTVASHADLQQVLAEQKFEFVQLNYSIVTRDAEERLLPFCQDRGVAVLVNRAFEDGRLFQATRGKPLPPWAADFDCTSWAQYFLKYVLSHPAVTCVIPATAKPKNQLDNLRGGTGRLPDARTRAKMVDYLAAL
jgi:diketogulonate reductase-like aldo/keto reductase